MIDLRILDILHQSEDEDLHELLEFIIESIRERNIYNSRKLKNE